MWDLQFDDRSAIFPTANLAECHSAAGIGMEETQPARTGRRIRFWFYLGTVA